MLTGDFISPLNVPLVTIGTTEEGNQRANSRPASLQSRLSRESGNASMPGSVGRALFDDIDEDDDESPDKQRLPTPAPVPDSLFQLDEETEPQPGDGEEKMLGPHQSPMASIEIRTFKMLKLVREQVNDSIDANKEGEGSKDNYAATHVTTVRIAKSLAIATHVQGPRHRSQHIRGPAICATRARARN